MLRHSFTPVARMSTTPVLPPCSHVPQKYTGPPHEEVLALRKKHLNPGLKMFYSKPLLVVEGNMQYLWDEKGKRYLDLFAGIVTCGVGHSHPRIVKVGQAQMAKLMHTTTVFLNSENTLYAKELTDKLPEHITNVYFTNSGSEANDLGILMARLYTGHQNVLHLRNGYHGMSMGTSNLTSLGTWKNPVAPIGGFLACQNADNYRGPWAGHPDAAEKYAWEVQNVIDHCTPGNVAAFIAEPIQGVGGILEYPEGYLKRVYEITRKAGGVCIADEVQTGFTRLGTHYWGFERAGVSPDIVVMAKSMGNGTPIGAVATTAEIANTMAAKNHLNTYGGNPLSSAIGREVLRVLDEEKIQQNCLVTGGYLKEGLQKLQAKYQVIGDVRGQGFMLGLELVTDREKKTPNPSDTNKLLDMCLELGLVIGKGGMAGNVLRIQPPMIITKQDVDFSLEVLDHAFSKL